uniref:Isopenicillin N synthase-like Fe(2+) 2OG dioxygenase domain-containing protein n=1 Tax=Manihot esculenta TaxID=3983 RepID=A0A2C9UYM7_MANES
MFESVEELFQLPLWTKMLNVSRKRFHGYIGQLPSVPLYESIGIEDRTMLEKVESLTNVLWPQGNPNFSKMVRSFSKLVAELESIVRKMILESLGMEKYIDEHMNSTAYLLRILNYEGPQTTESKPGILLIQIRYTDHIAPKSAPEELVDEEHPLLYKPFDYLEFLKFGSQPVLIN